MSTGSRSSLVPRTASEHHLFTIYGYSYTKGAPTGECIRSHPFIIGGHRWCIDYYPNGVCNEVADYISLSLVLDEDVGTAVVVAEHGIRLVGEGEEEQAVPQASKSLERFPSWCAASFTMFITRRQLESSKYLRNNSFTIRCDITVINDYSVQDTPPVFVSVPLCDLPEDLNGILETEKGADVVFEVGGETIAAHRCVLAARSQVFEAELFGPMKEGNAATTGVVVRVEDLEAVVFKALLRYMYTGKLPEMCKEDEDVTCQHLLVAADRYGIGRLKLMCEAKLCQYINVGSVAIILALAEQHQCVGLKKACFYFLALSGNLRAVMATEGFQHLATSCPSIVIEIMAFLAH